MFFILKASAYEISFQLSDRFNNFNNKRKDGFQIKIISLLSYSLLQLLVRFGMCNSKPNAFENSANEAVPPPRTSKEKRRQNSRKQRLTVNDVNIQHLALSRPLM